MNEKTNIANMSFEFALDIIDLYKILLAKREYIISKQLLRSGTSIGANTSEASAGQTKKDFIAKMAIASKEARETQYWLKLLAKSNLVNIDLSRYLVTIESIINILTKIVKTAQENLDPKPDFKV